MAATSARPGIETLAEADRQPGRRSGDQRLETVHIIGYSAQAAYVDKIIYLSAGVLNLSEDDKIEGSINAAANLANAVPIYQDAVQPLAQQTGKALGTIGEVVNAALLPIKGIVWGSERIEEWMQERVAKKLEDKDQETITSPNLSIAGPTVEALRFRGHEAEISEMFANLMANDMVINTKSKVHPTFVEAIKEITPLDAKLFAACVDLAPAPVAGFAIKTEGAQGDSMQVFPFSDDIIQKASLGRTIEISEWQVCVENLQRLGLVRLENDAWLTSEVATTWYKEAEEHKIAKELRSILPENKSLIVKKGILIVTQMGKDFSSVALASP